MGKKITPRSNDYSKWYNDIISEAGLAESSDVRGCMVIKPYGFAIWELMKSQLDDMFKETGHENAYFRGCGYSFRQGQANQVTDHGEHFSQVEEPGRQGKDRWAETPCLHGQSDWGGESEIRIGLGRRS